MKINKFKYIYSSYENSVGSLNPTVGDVPENAEKIFQFLEQAINNHCELIIFPELALVGYPLKDLIFYDLILERQNQVLSKLQRFSKKIIWPLSWRFGS